MKKKYSLTKSAKAKRVAIAKAARFDKNGKPLSMTKSAVYSRIKRAEDPLGYSKIQSIIQKAYREANKEKVAARQKAYRKENPEKIYASQKAWRKANPEKVAAYRAEYYELNIKTGFPLGRARIGEIRPTTVASIANADRREQELAKDEAGFRAKEAAASAKYAKKNPKQRKRTQKGVKLRAKRRKEIAERTTFTDKDGNV